MGPLPCLATKECKSAQNGQDHKFFYALAVHLMPLVYCKYHRYRTEDENKCHQAHKCQWKIGMAGKRKCIEYMVGIRPVIYAETDGAIADQESAKCERIAH